MKKLRLSLRAGIGMLLLLLWCLTMIGSFLLVRLVWPTLAARMPTFFHRGVCRIFAIRVECPQQCTTHRPTLFVGNHISYLDIFVLGAHLPGFFIAKSEVAKWPLLGTMARLQNTLFFERRGRRAAEQIEVMKKHLSDDGNLILFPEGTSTYGTSVIPFKSSLFKAAEMDNVDVMIQTFAISYTHCDGKVMDESTRDYFAWYDDTPFGKHFVRALGAPPAVAVISFADPVRMQDFDSRKECAQYCQAACDDLLQASLKAAEQP